MIEISPHLLTKRVGGISIAFLSQSVDPRTNAGARLTEALVRYSNVLSIAGQKRRDYRNAKIVEESSKCHKN